MPVEALQLQHPWAFSINGTEASVANMKITEDRRDPASGFGKPA